jgi:hypothetical protein
MPPNHSARGTHKTASINDLWLEFADQAWGQVWGEKRVTRRFYRHVTKLWPDWCNVISDCMGGLGEIKRRRQS